MIAAKADEREIQKLKEDPKRFAAEMMSRMNIRVVRARAVLLNLLSEDPSLAPHIARSLSKMPKAGALDALVFPIKDERLGALTGVGFEYRGDPTEARAAIIESRLTVVVGGVREGALSTAKPVPTEAVIRELDELGNIEHMCFRLLEVFGPIKD